MHPYSHSLTWPAIALACVAGSFASPLCAQTTRASIAVEECDADRDGNLDRDELKSCQAKLEASIRKPVKVVDCDTDGVANLSRAEIRECLRHLEPAMVQIAANAQTLDDVLDDIAGEWLDHYAAESLTVEQTQELFAIRAYLTAKEKPRVLFSDRFIFSRKLSDALDPRKAESSVPFVISYTDDRGAGNDAFLLAGEVTYDIPFQDVGSKGNLSMGFQPTLGFDLATSKEPFDSSITASLPWRWVWTSLGNGWFNTLNWSVEPKYNTDRDFRRDAYELAFGLSFLSDRLAKAGYTVPFGGDNNLPGSEYAFSWTPSLGVETGRITDAGFNEKLEAIRLQGEYVRLAPSIALKLALPFSAYGIVLSASHTQRFDVTDSWSRGLTTANVQYNLTKSASLTITRRKGRKPPDFVEVDDVLLGIGLIQLPPQ